MRLKRLDSRAVEVESKFKVFRHLHGSCGVRTQSHDNSPDNQNKKYTLNVHSHSGCLF